MSRMRQIPVMDITQQEKVMTQNTPAPHSVMRPTAPTCRMRPRRVPANKFRLSDTPTLLSNGCSSVREFCNSVQSITVDLNNLIGSVESILPLVTTYLAAVQARNMPPEQPVAEPPIDVAAPSRVEPVIEPPRPAAPATAPMAPNAMPRPEDIQQLLENPLVKNLLTNFIQGSSR